MQLPISYHINKIKTPLTFQAPHGPRCPTRTRLKGLMPIVIVKKLKCPSLVMQVYHSSYLETEAEDYKFMAFLDYRIISNSATKHSTQLQVLGNSGGPRWVMVHFLDHTSSKDYHGPWCCQRPCCSMWSMMLPQVIMKLKSMWTYSVFAADWSLCDVLVLCCLRGPYWYEWSL